MPPGLPRGFGFQHQDGGAFAQVQALAVPVKGPAGVGIGDLQGDETVVGDPGEFVGAAGQDQVAQAGPDPGRADAQGIGAGGAGIDEGLTGAAEAKVPGDHRGGIAVQDPVHGRQIRVGPGPVGPAEGLIVERAADRGAHANPDPQAGQGLGGQGGAGQGFPGRGQGEGAGAQQAGHRREVGHFEYRILDGMAGAEAGRRPGVSADLEQRLHTGRQGRPQGTQTAQARDGDRPRLAHAGRC